MLNRKTLKKKQPKYQTIEEDLRKKIKDGIYRPGTRLPPDSELYKVYAANRLTVIRALEILARDGLIVRQHGSGTFVADETQKPFIPGRTCRLGLLSGSHITAERWHTGIESAITNGILQEWGIREPSPIIEDVGPTEAPRVVLDRPLRGLRVTCLGDPYAAVTRHPPLQTVKQGRFDGLITMGIYDEEWLAKVLALGVPTVIVDNPTRRFGHLADQVYVDPQTGYGAAVDYFLERSKRRIHFVGQLLWETAPNEEMTWDEWKEYRIGRQHVNVDSFLRLTAVRQSLLEHGMELPDEYVHYVPSQPKAHAELAEKLLGLPDDERPDVVIAHDLGIVSGLTNRFHKRGLPLVGAGAGNLGSAPERNGGLATIHVKHEELGTVAADLLRARLQRPDRLFLNVGIRTRFEPPRA